MSETEYERLEEEIEQEMMEVDESDPLVKAFGKDYAIEYYRKVGKLQAKFIPLPKELVEEIKQYVHLHKDELLENKGHIVYNNYDVVLAVTPNNENSLKRVMLEKTGTLMVSMLSSVSATGWLSCMFNDPHMADDLELNTAYIIIGKLREREVDGILRHSMTVRGIIKA